jgi:hypothetical protein
MKTLSKHQMTVMETLYDVANHEGGGIILKNRYHSPAHALILRGYVRKVDRFPWRPHYFITDAGMAYWSSFLTRLAADLATASGKSAVVAGQEYMANKRGDPVTPSHSRKPLARSPRRMWRGVGSK